LRACPCNRRSSGHAARAGRQAAKDVATANDDTSLHAERLNLTDLLGDLGGDLRIDSEALLAMSASPESFSRTRR